eukprot:12896222-Prorocentrum_lima.AAC.1
MAPGRQASRQGEVSASAASHRENNTYHTDILRTSPPKVYQHFRRWGKNNVPLSETCLLALPPM